MRQLEAHGNIARARRALARQGLIIPGTDGEGDHGAVEDQGDSHGGRSDRRHVRRLQNDHHQKARARYPSQTRDGFRDRDAHEAGRIDPRGCGGQGHLITGRQPGAPTGERRQSERKSCMIVSAKTRSRLPKTRLTPSLSTSGQTFRDDTCAVRRVCHYGDRGR